MRGATTILFVSLVIPATAVCAQENSQLEIGDLLRISAPDCGLDAQLARYLRLYRDTLTVQADSALALPVASITGLDVSRGLSIKPTLVGIVVGASVGIVVGIAFASDEGSQLSGGSTSQTTVGQIGSSGGTGGSTTMSGAVVGPVAGALIGAFVGGLVGKVFREHHWEAVPLHKLRVGVVPQKGGTVSVGLSVMAGAVF